MFYIEIIKEDLKTLVEQFGRTKQEAIVNAINDLNGYFNCNCKTLNEVCKHFRVVEIRIKKID